MLLGRAGKLVFWRHSATGELVNIEVLDWVGYCNVFTPQPAANERLYFGNVLPGRGHWRFDNLHRWIQILIGR